MGVITTQLLPSFRRLPYIGPVGEPEIWWTQLPKAEVVFQEYDTTVTAGEVGDSQKLTIQCNVPTSYAYVLQELSMVMYGSDIDDWQAASFVTLSDGTGAAGWSYSPRFEANLAIGNSAGTIRTWNVQEPGVPKKVMIAVTAGNIFLEFYNANLDGAAANIRFFCRFLQFDLNQAFRTSINSPILVR